MTKTIDNEIRIANIISIIETILNIFMGTFSVLFSESDLTKNRRKTTARKTWNINSIYTDDIVPSKFVFLPTTESKESFENESAKRYKLSRFKNTIEKIGRIVKIAYNSVILRLKKPLTISIFC